MNNDNNYNVHHLNLRLSNFLFAFNDRNWSIVMNHDNDDYIFDHNNNDMVNDYCHNGDKDDGDNDSK